MIAWRSDPRSIVMSGPNGYGPPSLSLAYVNSIDTSECDGWTTSNGMPYEGGPKSGCSWLDPACALRFHLSLFGCFASPEMSMCHTLSAGNAWQLVPGNGSPRAGPPETGTMTAPATIMLVATTDTQDLLIADVSAGRV